MRRLFLFIVAATMAIGFSAFTAKKSPPQTYYYQDGTGTWRMIVLSLPPCPAGTIPNCFYPISGTPRQMFNQPNLDFPYLRNQQ